MKYLPDNYYHIYNRGAHKREIFFEWGNYTHLLNLFRKYLDMYGITMATYCLMPNHYHLVIKQLESGSIGNYLRTTFNAYTQSVNKRYGLSGTLFQGQSKMKHIDSDNYCVQVVRYIHLNPVIAGLVSAPEDWEFSNYLEWVGTRVDVLFDSRLKAAYFGDGENYSQFVSEYLEENDMNIVRRYYFNDN